MKHLSPTPNRRGKTAVIIVVAILATLFLVAFTIAPSRTTFFAPDLPPGGFRQIRMGLSVTRVRELVGEPLSISIESDELEHWHYSKPAASSDHMVRRCVIVERNTGTVHEVDGRTLWDPIGHFSSGGRL